MSVFASSEVMEEVPQPRGEARENLLLNGVHGGADRAQVPTVRKGSLADRARPSGTTAGRVASPRSCSQRTTPFMDWG